jgi:hypothetical protein
VQVPALSHQNQLAWAAIVFSVLCWPLGVLVGHLARRRSLALGGIGSGLAFVALVISYTLGFATLLLFVIHFGGAGGAKYV